MLWVKDDDTATLSADQKRAIREHRSLTVARAAAVRAGRCGQDHLDASRCAPPRTAPQRQVLVLAPTGKAVDEAMREGAGDEGYTSPKPCNSCGTTN